MSDDNNDDLDEMEEHDDPAEFEAAKERLCHRCDAAHIKHSEEVGWDEETKILVVNMPCGRETCRVLIVSTQEADRLLSIPFEKYSMLGEYVGLCSYSDGTIEANVRPVGSGGFSSHMMRRLLSQSKSAEEKSETIMPLVLQQEDSGTGIVLQLGPPSKDFSILQSLYPGWNAPFTLSLSRTSIKTHEKALRLIERLAHSFFFQISLSHGFSMTLQREVRGRRTLSGARRESPGKPTFPKREYDPQPMSLFWYAKSAVGMPLLRFLAFYQVLEFYMPTFSNQEAIGRVRNILKDPRFSPDTDSQVSRILASLRSSGRGFGDERSQLEAVIRRCVSPQELREFFTRDEFIRKYYEDDYKHVTPFKIPLQNEASDLISETAQRLYEIRCRIVHTKDASDRDLAALLPFSREASDLLYDIALVEMIATSALIASSMPMRAE